MVICASYMFEFGVDKAMKKRINNDERRNLAHLLALLVKVLKISLEQGRVVTTLNVIKH